MAIDHWHSAAAARTFKVGSVNVVRSTFVPSWVVSTLACESLMMNSPVKPDVRLAALHREVRHMIVDIFCTSHPPVGALAWRSASYCVHRPATGTGAVVGAGAGVVGLGVAGELVGMRFQGW